MEPLSKTMKSRETLKNELLEATGDITRAHVLLEAVLDVRDMMMGYIDGINHPEIFEEVHKEKENVS